MVADSNTGAGQQDPGTSNSDFTATAFLVRQMLAKLDTVKLVKVVKVTGGGGAIAAAGTVDVQLLINQIDGAGRATAHGVVYGIPWYRLQGGKNAVIIDPKVGDVGLVLCADRDISALKAASTKDKVNPGSRRKYNVADGIYIGGALNEAPEQHLVFTDDKITVTDKTGNVVELSPAGIKLKPAGSLPVTVDGNLVITGNLQLGGSVLAQTGGVYGGNLVTSGAITSGSGGASVTLRTHTHPANGQPPTPGT